MVRREHEGYEDKRSKPLLQFAIIIDMQSRSDADDGYSNGLA